MLGINLMIQQVIISKQTKSRFNTIGQVINKGKKQQAQYRALRNSTGNTSSLCIEEPSQTTAIACGKPY